MELVERIVARRHRLTPAEIRVAEFLADNPHSVGHHSALKLAAAVGVSDATVVRTVRKLGFSGLGDLREELAEELSRGGRMGSSLEDGEISRTISVSVSAVRTLADRVGEDDLQRAVDCLGEAESVTVVGFGPSRHIAEYAVSRCRRAGVDAVAAGCTGLGFADELAALHSGSAVVLLAYDGTSREVEVLYERAGELGVPVVQLTEGPLTSDERATVALGVGRGDPEFSPSYVSTVAVLEALIVAAAAKRPEQGRTSGELIDDLRSRLGDR